MPVRFTRVFGLYTFFSVFLPGLTFLLGVAPLVSVLANGDSTATLLGEEGGRQLLAVLGLLVFVTLSMFVGFGLHTLGAWLEDKVGDSRMWPDAFDSICLWGRCLGTALDKLTIRIGKRHRRLFFETVNGYNDDVDPRFVSAFVDVADATFPYLELESADQSNEAIQPQEWTRKHLLDAIARTWPPESRPASSSGGDVPSQDGGVYLDPISKPQADSLYTLVRSQIHMDQRGRSRTFQAVFSACRSTFVAWILLTFLYLGYVSAVFLVASDISLWRLSAWETSVLTEQTLDISTPFVTEPSVLAAFGFTITVGFFGTFGFAAVARNSKRYYLKYLISDFLLLQSGTVETGSDGDEVPRTQH